MSAINGSLQSALNNSYAFGNPNSPPNRFSQDLVEKSQTAFKGHTDTDYLKAATNGNLDFTKHVRISIRHEFFSLPQYVGGVILGICLGAIIFLFLGGAMYGYNYRVGDAYQVVFGAFFLLFAFGIILGERFNRRGKRCVMKGKYTKYVSPQYKNERTGKGAECFEDQECTDTNIVPPGQLCRIPPYLPHMYWGRTITKYLSLLTGIGLVVWWLTSDSSGSADGPTLSTFCITGFAMGYVWCYMWS